jgi:hypothetical protein
MRRSQLVWQKLEICGDLMGFTAHAGTGASVQREPWFPGRIIQCKTEVHAVAKGMTSEPIDILAFQNRIRMAVRATQR